MTRFFKQASSSHVTIDELRKIQAGVLAELHWHFVNTVPSIANASVSTFVKWALENEDVTVAFVARLTITYLEAIFVFFTRHTQQRCKFDAGWTRSFHASVVGTAASHLPLYLTP
jgi:hypothetical protein